MKRRGVLAVLLVSCVLFVAVGVGLVAESTEKVPVIVGFVGEPDVDLIRAYGGVIKYVYSLIPAVACSLSRWAIMALLVNPGVVYVEVDGVVEALGQVLPWGVDRIDADLAWVTTVSSLDVDVAVLDTGVDKDHPDLYVERGISFADPNPENWDDKNGHGTHVAGIIAALDNDIGVVGVAPGAGLWAVKVMKTRIGFWSDVIEGIEWSVREGAEVISMSIGGGDNEAVHDAVDAAYEAGVVLVAAAGNDGGDVIYPAAYSSVIAVSATDQNDDVTWWSNRGPEIELAAPGKDIYSTYKGGGYATMSGTSMSCPHVSGTVALILSTPIPLNYDVNGDGTWDPGEVRTALQLTAEDLPPDGRDDYSGYGLVDAEKAVARRDVYFLLTVEPVQETYSGGQTLTFTVHVFNEMVTVLDSTLTLLVTGPDDYYLFDFERISVTADAVSEYSFSWDVPDVAGTYIVEVGLVPPMLTAYDAVWLMVV